MIDRSVWMVGCIVAVLCSYIKEFQCHHMLSGSLENENQKLRLNTAIRLPKETLQVLFLLSASACNLPLLMASIKCFLFTPSLPFWSTTHLNHPHLLTSISGLNNV